jgi:hypothetical protein
MEAIKGNITKHQDHQDNKRDSTAGTMDRKPEMDRDGEWKARG